MEVPKSMMRKKKEKGGRANMAELSSAHRHSLSFASKMSVQTS